MKTPQVVLDLVDRFECNRDVYRSNAYNETQARHEFIDPFFKALGWDVNNEKGYAEAYKEVIHEDAIKVGGATKAPDYCFRIGGVRKFFVEAKRPGVNLKEEANAAYQLRRYAWSAKLPLSILTDFEEFAIYDCRFKPAKTDKASTGRVLYLTANEYVDQWDEIASIFSPEAIHKGSFDKYIESTKRKKGTAEVDTAFLKEIEAWRDMLARNIALRNTELSTHELNFTVQRTIDRIIFLRICEDRGIEDYGQLMALQSGNRVYPRLCQIFRRADERYNSGLFHFRKDKDRPEPPDGLTLNLAIDDKVLKGILKELYYPESPYEFSVLPADILGQVYEQFLGKVIRLTAGHRAKVEDKPEVKKAGGVYYTPTYIVDYIVEHTVGKLLEGKTPQQASKLRILDPACGSGSFLLGAYQTLLDWHLKWYAEHEPEKHAKGRQSKVFRGPGGDWRLTTAERKRILLNNIYGVDIDPQAVEVTKLSLLLKVLEGENEETLVKHLRLFHERALPDLADNIKCGNSLIGPDFYEGKQLNLLDEEERYRINAFDWNAEFPHIFPSPTGKAHPSPSPAGRGQGEGSGFDAVIGNPPYVRVQRFQHDEADYFYRRYETPVSKTDLSQLFLEKALELVAERGRAGFICTSQWMSTDYGAKMRALLSQGSLEEIVDFGSLPVFRSASTYPAIFVLTGKPTNSLIVHHVRDRSALTATGIRSAASRKIKCSTLSSSPWNLSEFDLLHSLGRANRDWKQLSAFAQAYYGVVTGMDSVFVVSASQKEELKLEDSILFPFVYRGEEVRRYSVVDPTSFVIYPYEESQSGVPKLIPEQSLRDNYPNVHSYLEAHRERLKSRKDSRRLYASGKDWYRHARPSTFARIRPAKMIAKGIGKRLHVGLARGGTCFSGANCPGIIHDDEGPYSQEFLLGLLNSRLLAFHLRTVCPPKLSGYRRFTTTALNKVPVPVLDLTEKSARQPYDNMVELVEQMLALQRATESGKTAHDRKLIQRQIDATDKQIDQLVYELYGLTEEEIRIIESQNKREAKG